MSIHDNNQNPAGQTQTQPTPAAAPQPAPQPSVQPQQVVGTPTATTQQQAAPGQIPGWNPANYNPAFGGQAPNFGNQNNAGQHALSLDNFSREISRSLDSDVLMNMTTSIEEILKFSPQTKADLKFISADIAEKDVPYSMLFIAKPVKVAGNKTLVPYYTIVLATTRGESIEPVQVNTMNGPLSIPVVPSDALANTAVQAEIRDLVAKGLGNAYGTNIEMFDTGSTVVGEFFDAKDFQQVKTLLSDGLIAINNRLNRLSSNGKVFTVASLANKRVATRAQFNAAQSLDAVKNPIRTDITLTVTTSDINTNNQQNKWTGKVREVVSVGGYIDLINVDQQRQGMYAFAQPQQQQFAYLPVFVMTKIQSTFDLSSDQVVLLAISTVGALAARKNWARALIAQEANILHDFGAIGLETPRFASTDGKPTKIELRKLNPQQQAALLNDAVGDNLLIDIDVPETGDTGRMLELINGVSHPDQAIKAQAIARLVKAADDLSLNHFSPVWNQTLAVPGVVNSFTVGVGTKVFNGYYHDSNRNEPSDIRNIDHLAALMIQGTQDPNIGRAYDFTYVSGEGADIQGTRRLELQERLIGGAGMVTLTGASYRHRLNPALVQALDKALRGAGLHIDLANPGYNGNNLEMITIDQFVGQGLSSQQFQGLYTGAQYNSVQGGNNTTVAGRYRG